MADQQGDDGGDRGAGRPDPGPPGYAGLGYGRGYGRDFGGGLGGGFAGSWGQGYGGTLEYEEPDQLVGAPEGGDMEGDETWPRSSGDAGAAARGPFAGRGPKGWRPSDARLKERVCEGLMEDPFLDARGIEVEAQGGMVTLRGEVRRPADLSWAETLAREAAGSAEVVSRLQVSGG